MKKEYSVFLLIFIISLFSACLSAQVKHPGFPFGFYSYYNGLRWVNEQDYCSVDRIYSLPMMWNRSFKTNFYVFDAHNCHSGCSWLQMAKLASYDKEYYDSGVLLPPVLRTHTYINYMNNEEHFWKYYPQGYNVFPGLVAMSESNYFTFDRISVNDEDGFVTDLLPRGVSLDPRKRVLSINLKGNPGEFRLIRDVRIKNAPPSNTSFLKPGTFNIRKAAAGNHAVAEFFIRLKISSSLPLPEGSYIRFRLINKYKGSPDRENDLIEKDEYGKPLKIPLDKSSDGEFELPFVLQAQRNANEKIFSAWTFGFSLEAYLYAAPQKDNRPVEFSIESLAVYDKLGFEVMNHFITRKPAGKSYPDYYRLLKEGYAAFNSPIIHLSDEPFIANFLPAKTLLLDLSKMNPALFRRSYFYFTQPDPGMPEQCRRLLRELLEKEPLIPGLNKKIKMGIDFYPFLLSETAPADFENNIKEFSSLYRDFKQLCKSYGIDDLISVPQLFGYDSKQPNGATWRLPDFSEICSQSYIALLAGFRGILYYEAAFNPTETNLYIMTPEDKRREEFLYVPHLSDPGSSKSNLHPASSSAVRKIGEFLNRKTGLKEYPFNGDIFMHSDFGDFVIAGFDGNYYGALPDLQDGKTGINRIEILESEGKPVTGKQKAFAGLGKARDSRDPDVDFVFTANLYTGDIKVRLFLTEGKNEAEIKNVNDPQSFRILSKDTKSFDISLKANEAILLRLERK